MSGRPNKPEEPTSEELEAEELLPRIAAGEERAAETLFKRYRGMVYRLARGVLNDRERALDVVQEVFVRVFRAADRFRAGARFTTWLYRITTNCCYDALRRSKTHPEEPVDKEVFDLSERDCEGPGESARRRELQAALSDAVARLSPKLREVFALRFFEELSYERIAEVVGCSTGTVMSRLFYARQRLRELLIDYL